jgi:hypothetical protein
MIAPARAAEIVAAVRQCVGTRFRVQGRVPGLALDCVGVALVAAQASGCRVGDVPPYRLGGDHEALVDAFVEQLGLLRCAEAAPGDLLLYAPAIGRRHLAVQTSAYAETMVVHAHAGIGRVVEAPPDPDWVLISTWRFPKGY